MPHDADRISFGPRIVDARGELLGGKAAEDDGVDRADARAGEHRENRLGHGRHIDDDAVAFLDALARRAPARCATSIAQLDVGERVNGLGDRAVVDERTLLAAPAFDVPIDGVVAGVQHRRR